jgi:hypothetical protein
MSEYAVARLEDMSSSAKREPTMPSPPWRRPCRYVRAGCPPIQRYEGVLLEKDAADSEHY